MTLKVTIHPTKDYSGGGSYPVVYTYDDGVVVGSAGELNLVSSRLPCGRACEFRIYAPGTWREVNTEWLDDGEGQAT